jgi:GGDEF domain-containing protein
MPPGWVSTRVRAIEPWALAALSFSTAATAVVLWPGLLASWLLALVPLLAARWAHSGAARHPSELALRGTLVVCAVLLLQLHRPADAGAAALLTQAWLAVACAAYAFMLRPAWACGVTSVALVVLAAVRLLSGEPPTPVVAIAEGLGVVLPALLAATAGAAMRRADAQRECSRFDAATGLYSHEGLLSCGHELLARCLRRRRAVTMAVFDCSDLLEVRRIYGPQVARHLALSVARQLSRVAGDKGMAARSGMVEFSLVLPGLDREQALRAIQQVLGSPTRVEYEAGGVEIVLVPNFVLAPVESTDDDIARVHAGAIRKLAASREQEERRHRSMRRARERHSRPGSQARQEMRSARERALAKTVPMPLMASS